MPTSPPSEPFLFNEAGLEHYEQVLARGIELVRERIASVEGPFTGVAPEALASAFADLDLEVPCPHLETALAELEQLYLRDAVFFHHPRYVAHLNCPIAIPAILAELILSSINSSLDTWDQSAGGTFIEQKLIDWTAGRLGLGRDADGVFTSGGTQSNLMALLLARDACCARMTGGEAVKQRGLPANFARLRILASEVSHFSVQKAAAILGLGYDAVIPVACDRHYRMDPAALRRTLHACRADGLEPMAVVATAGTTDFGSIDPLPAVARLCRQQGVWMHVDAAYGCGLLLSGMHRSLLAGIEHADSVTVDYHKSFFQPVSCSALLARDRRHFGCVTYHADYLNPLSQRQAGTPNLVDKSLQTTRRFDALKLWLTLRTVGAESIGSAFDQVLALARRAYLMLHLDDRFETLHPPQLSTLVFRYRPATPHDDAVVDAANAHIRQAIVRSGEASIAETKVQGRRCLKFTLLNPATTLEDLRAICELIKHHGDRFFQAQGADHDRA